MSRLFAETVASAVAPSAVVLTGDLTDSKTNAGIGLQQPEEWQVHSPPSLDVTPYAAQVLAAG